MKISSQMYNKLKLNFPKRLKKKIRQENRCLTNSLILGTLCLDWHHFSHLVQFNHTNVTY